MTATVFPIRRNNPELRNAFFHRSFASLLTVLFALSVTSVSAQTPTPAPAAQSPKPRPKPAPASAPRPKLVVLLVVDQMRADYVDKFRYQWTGGLKRLVDEGAWYRAAAYPYAATETCVGHSTISTGSFPSTHGMIANQWWDRPSQKTVTCTADASVQNSGYAGVVPTTPGDSAVRMLIPSFAEELKFQTGGATRVVTFSLKARAAITMAGHKGDAATWVDGGGLVTSSAYGTLPFIETYAKEHPIKEDYGKTWKLALPESEYLYDEKATGAAPPAGWDLAFPHALRGKGDSPEPDNTYYEQWATSPYADDYLTHLAETAVDSLGLGKSGATDFLGVSYSSIDYVGHRFGPRSREIQDILITLDRNLAELFAHLDRKVGRGNYVVALSADHGATPIPEDFAKTGVDTGFLDASELKDKIVKALEPFNFPKSANADPKNYPIAKISSGDLYFASGLYERIRDTAGAMQAVTDAAMSVPGVGGIYWSDDLQNSPLSQDRIRAAVRTSFLASRSGDLYFVPKPYWLVEGSKPANPHATGTGHGGPYNYDQHVPILLMGFGIQPGQYFREVTPADIAPTLAALTGVTLAPRDGHILAEALAMKPAPAARARTAPPAPAP
ncbi:MAG: alkaline phosphatase family protein [Acidobacteria bacterium]|nr:alkaline phosphatase family protein [Acidobacteriota bacterium]